MTRRSAIIGAAAAILLCTGFLAGWRFGAEWFGEAEPASKPYEIRETGFQFINPLLECEVFGAAMGSGEIRPFQKKIQDFVAERLSGKRITHVSVYFRDLNNGPWFGINEDAEYSPASLLKVVIMIAGLKHAEKAPAFLAKKVPFLMTDADDNRHENIRPSRTIERGHAYTVDELIAMMIQHSDNNAMRLLLSVMDRDLLRETYADLGLNLPEQALSVEDFMSVKMYASVFRVLFNASYLNREMSEKALGYLSRSEFDKGIVEGVPPDIPVAHKFGERVIGPDRGIRQLHDCGIVYYPGHPYLLCVMTRGNAYLFLSETIQDVSRLVFREVHRQHGVR